jgi:xanthine dehydrogenase accessory factor
MSAWLDSVLDARARGVPASLVTVVRCSGSTPVAPGARMVVFADGSIAGTIGGGHLEQLAIADAVSRLRGEAETGIVRYPLGATAGQCCGGIVEVFVEALNQGPVLYLFGAGHVGQAVCRALAGTPFVVHAIDEREDWSAAVPASVHRHTMAWDEFVRDASFSAERTYVAIMTHRHDIDEAIVADVVKRPARYLGLIGSRTKWQRFRQRLVARGLEESALDRVHCPIGLDIGGKAPQEVALSVAAQLLAVHHGRPAGR